MSEESYSEYIFKGTSVAFVASVVTGLLGLGMRMFLSRALSPEEYGILFAVFSLFGFLGLLRGLGLGNTIVKFLPEFREKENYTYLKSSITISLIIQLSLSALIVGVTFLFSGEIASAFIGNKAAEPIIRLLGVFFWLMAFIRFGPRIFSGFKDIPRAKSVELVRLSSLFLLLLGLSFVLDLNATSAALIYVTSGAIASVWILLQLRSYSSILRKGELKLSKKITKKLLIFGIPLAFAGIAGVTTSYIDTIVITWFRTPTEVGLYQVARPATRAIQLAGLSLGAPLFPMISELWAKKDEKRLSSTLYYTLKFPLLVLIPMALVFLAFPEIIIRVLFSSKYLAAATTLRILTLTMIVATLFSLFKKTLIGIGKNKLFAKIYGVAAVLNVVGDIVLVPIIGIEGAALAFLLSFLVALILEIYYAHQNVRFPVPKKALRKMVLGGIATLTLLFLLKEIITISPWWLKIPAVILPSGLFYLIWIFRTKTLTSKDIKLLKKNVPIPDWAIKVLRKLAP